MGLPWPLAPPRPDADVSFPSHYTSRHYLRRLPPEVPPHIYPVTANQLFQRFLVLAPRFGTVGRGSEGRVPIGSRSGGLWELIGWRAVALWHACAASRTCGGRGDRVCSLALSPAVAPGIARRVRSVHFPQQVSCPRLASAASHQRPTPTLVPPACRSAPLAAFASPHMASSAQSGGPSGGPAVPTVQRGIVKMVRAGPGTPTPSACLWARVRRRLRFPSRQPA